MSLLHAILPRCDRPAILARAIAGRTRSVRQLPGPLKQRPPRTGCFRRSHPLSSAGNNGLVTSPRRVAGAEPTLIEVRGHLQGIGRSGCVVNERRSPESTGPYFTQI